MTNETPPLGANLPAWPEQDFSAFGETEQKPLSRIQSLTASFMHRNWLSIPHVTHHDELDITALETFRKALPPPASGARITPLAFQVKALVAALKEFPHFNASLDAAGKTVTLKKYYNVGIAVDTPMGLLVPVLRDCDAKSVAEIATELAAISHHQRAGSGDPGRDSRPLGAQPPRRGGGTDRVAAVAAGVPQLRPSRDQRHRRRPLHPVPGRGAGDAGGAVEASTAECGQINFTVTCLSSSQASRRRTG